MSLAPDARLAAELVPLAEAQHANGNVLHLWAAGHRPHGLCQERQDRRDVALHLYVVERSMKHGAKNAYSTSTYYRYYRDTSLDCVVDALGLQFIRLMP